MNPDRRITDLTIKFALTAVGLWNSLLQGGEPISLRTSATVLPRAMTGGVYAQIAIALLVIMVLALTPVRRGTMIVWPVSSTPAKPWLDHLSGVTLLGVGKLPGSLIITGDRNALWPVAIAHRALLLPAVPALCSAAQPSREEL